MKVYYLARKQIRVLEDTEEHAIHNMEVAAQALEDAVAALEAANIGGRDIMLRTLSDMAATCCDNLHLMLPGWSAYYG